MLDDESHPDNAWSGGNMLPGCRSKPTHSETGQGSKKVYAGWNLNHRDPDSSHGSDPRRKAQDFQYGYQAE